MHAQEYMCTDVQKLLMVHLSTFSSSNNKRSFKHTFVFTRDQLFSQAYLHPVHSHFFSFFLAKETKYIIYC